MGDEASANRADLLDPLEFHAGWRRVETFCDVDPYDPEAPEPTNLDNARTALERIKPETVWLHMSSTMKDHDLEYASHGLVRFDPELLVAKFRAVVSGASGAYRTTASPTRLAFAGFIAGCSICSAAKRSFRACTA